MYVVSAGRGLRRRRRARKPTHLTAAHRTHAHPRPRAARPVVYDAVTQKQACLGGGDVAGREHLGRLCPAEEAEARALGCINQHTGDRIVREAVDIIVRDAEVPDFLAFEMVEGAILPHGDDVNKNTVAQLHAWLRTRGVADPVDKSKAAMVAAVRNMKAGWYRLTLTNPRRKRLETKPLKPRYDKLLSNLLQISTCAAT